MDISHLLLYIIGCILLIGFFAGTEIAFISANKLNIELRKKQGKFSGQILARFMENPSEFIGTSLVGVNVLLVIYGLLAAQATTLALSHYHNLGICRVFTKSYLPLQSRDCAHHLQLPYVADVLYLFPCCQGIRIHLRVHT